MLLAVRTAMEHHIGALPRTPFCHYVAFPLKGKREIWREEQGVIYFRYHFGVFPLWWLAPPPCTVGSMSYDTESKSVTLALYLSPDRAIPQPSARRAVKLKNPWARKGPSILRTFPFTTFLHNPPPSGGHNPRAGGPSTLTPEGRLAYFFIDISHFSMLYCTLRAGKMIAGRKA